jgi:hypothetical protein
MRYEQQASPCKEHGGCTLIVGLQDGRQVSESHLAKEVPAGARANLDHPEIHDGKRILKWELLGEEQAEILLGGPHEVREHRRHVAYHAHLRGLIDIHDAAQAVGVSAEALRGEASEKNWQNGGGTP